MSAGGWIGVDLDGTLAQYDGWVSASHIGEPVPLMVERVVGWLARGRDVRIFTARVSVPDVPLIGTGTRVAEAAMARTAIEAWCEKHIGKKLPVTCCKDYGMVELWDDRAVQVEMNTGRVLAAPFTKP